MKKLKFIDVYDLAGSEIDLEFPIHRGEAVRLRNVNDLKPYLPLSENSEEELWFGMESPVSREMQWAEVSSVAPVSSVDDEALHPASIRKEDLTADDEWPALSLNIGVLAGHPMSISNEELQKDEKQLVLARRYD